MLTKPMSAFAAYALDDRTAALSGSYGFLKSAKANSAAAITVVPVRPEQSSLVLIAFVSPILHF